MEWTLPCSVTTCDSLIGPAILFLGCAATARFANASTHNNANNEGTLTFETIFGLSEY
jgi:hypothetical protein